jgi:hypothetical protein
MIGEVACHGVLDTRLRAARKACGDMRKIPVQKTTSGAQFVGRVRDIWHVIYAQIGTGSPVVDEVLRVYEPEVSGIATRVLQSSPLLFGVRVPLAFLVHNTGVIGSVVQAPKVYPAITNPPVNTGEPLGSGKVCRSTAVIRVVIGREYEQFLLRDAETFGLSGKPYVRIRKAVVRASLRPSIFHRAPLRDSLGSVYGER